ncbi:MAG: Dabb family protein [Deltaproteobacteria bacterium]|nr:Dabb family protein [Deltaproteobacteria bacterium]
MIKHIVVIKFNEGKGAAEAQILGEKFAQLPAQIPEIKEFIFGADVLHTPRSYDYALVSLFADSSALMRYQQHPAHIPVLEYVRSIATSIIVVDFAV